MRRHLSRLYWRVRPLGHGADWRPSLGHTRRFLTCGVFGHWFDGQFCGRCGWFLP